MRRTLRTTVLLGYLGGPLVPCAAACLSIDPAPGACHGVGTVSHQAAEPVTVVGDEGAGGDCCAFLAASGVSPIAPLLDPPSGAVMSVDRDSPPACRPPSPVPVLPAESPPTVLRI